MEFEGDDVRALDEADLPDEDPEDAVYEDSEEEAGTDNVENPVDVPEDNTYDATTVMEPDSTTENATETKTVPTDSNNEPNLESLSKKTTVKRQRSSTRQVKTSSGVFLVTSADQDTTPKVAGEKHISSC